MSTASAHVRSLGLNETFQGSIVIKSGQVARVFVHLPSVPSSMMKLLRKIDRHVLRHVLAIDAFTLWKPATLLTASYCPGILSYLPI
jgi:hypothetical protein